MLRQSPVDGQRIVWAAVIIRHHLTSLPESPFNSLCRNLPASLENNTELEVREPILVAGLLLMDHVSH